MATRRTGTRPPLIPDFSTTRLLLLVFALSNGLAKASCGVEFLYPQADLTFHYLDTVNVTYTSNFSNPSLFCWCGQAHPDKKSEIKAPAFNSSLLVLLNFESTDPCWFDLRPDTGACGDNSPHFALLPDESKSRTTLGLLSATSTAATSSETGSPSGFPADPDSSPHGELSAGARAGIAIAVIGVSIVGMAACFYFWRRKRLRTEDGVGGRRKKALEKLGGGRVGGSQISNQSAQPLQGLEPVYDGYPGSTGYQDGQSLGSSVYQYSPTLSANGGYFSPEREELEAARTRHELEEARKREEIRLLSSPAASTIVSYGPNPITPSLSPRPSRRFDAPASPSWEQSYGEYYAPAVEKVTSLRVPNSSTVHRTATAQSYSQTPAEYYAPSVQSTPPPPQRPSPPSAAPSSIASYAPNSTSPMGTLTPTTTTPPNDAFTSAQQQQQQRRRQQQRQQDEPEFPVMDIPSHPFPSHELQAHESLDSTSLADESPGSATAPLPPYASAAEFFAMETGAIRKLDEPRAMAELPPTKDGYYQYGDRTDEYELQGTTLLGEQLHPHQPYKNQADVMRDRRGRDVDEQKVLLSDVEIGQLREMKAKKRAEESYEMQPAGRSRQQPPGTSPS